MVSRLVSDISRDKWDMDRTMSACFDHTQKPAPQCDVMTRFLFHLRSRDVIQRAGSKLMETACKNDL
jgi:hypothetical protein